MKLSTRIILRSLILILRILTRQQSINAESYKAEVDKLEKYVALAIKEDA